MASHRATIHKGAIVRGTIVTPCLMLEDGSTFHGNIDMDPESDLLKSAFGELPDSRQALSSSPDSHDSGVTDSDEFHSDAVQAEEARQAGEGS